MHKMTTKGFALLGKQQVGLAQPNVTRVVAGAGYVDPALLEQQTGVSQLITEMEVGEKHLVDGMIIRLPVQLSNLELTTTALIRQIGVYSQDPDEGEILYQIVQYETPVALPAYASNSGGVILFDPELDVLFSNGEIADTPLTPGFLVTAEKFRERMEDHEQKTAYDEAHGMRVVSGELQLFDGVAWLRAFSIPGINWTARQSAADNNWTSVTYGNGLFVAVASSGSGNRVMTSPDGIRWTVRQSALDSQWRDVAYGNGMFVVMGHLGINYRIMTSPDGITWTACESAADNNWQSVTYGNGLFVAVAGSGTGNRVMTSPVGLDWTIRQSAADNNWISIVYGNGLFVAVANSGTGNRVMTSPDGIN